MRLTAYGGRVCQDTEVPFHKVEHPPVLEDPQLDSCGSRGCGEVVNCGFFAVVHLSTAQAYIGEQAFAITGLQAA